ncbi:VOC family protein [Pseudogulbenkiania sp. MAI-1]|uniref:VOC family protein n=1 Tax=Pseudogulbenkiania sp. MAI-1 TaxID=990370 RepID=UPI00045EAEDF|nr:VOC family protein [Pseudogulbenkiania sp. MAI-1]
MSKSPIIGFDHPVIAVRDMEESRRRYERMGFFVPPRGSHMEWGTGNWCIMFPHDYLELRGIVDPARYTHKLDEFLAEREGLMGVAFTGDRDNHEAVHYFVERGLAPHPVRELTRRFERPDGETHPSFRLLFFKEGETGPMMASLICQHLTPELIREPSFFDHPNKVTSILSMTGVAEDLKATAELLQKYFNDGSIELSEQQLSISVGRGAELIVVTPEEAVRQGLVIDTTAPYLTAIAMQTTSLQACEEALKQGGIPYSRHSENRLRVSAEAACGVTLDFVAA